MEADVSPSPPGQAQVGSVGALWRYPVKSMMGEELNSSEVTDRGLLGDRQFAGQNYELHRTRGVYLGAREILFFLRTIAACPRILCYPELLCNFVRWLGYYGYVTKHYQPRKGVVHFFEGTASSSLMSWPCGTPRV